MAKIKLMIPKDCKVSNKYLRKIQKDEKTIEVNINKGESFFWFEHGSSHYNCTLNKCIHLGGADWIVVS